MRKLLYICITVLLLVPFVCLPAGAGDANVVFTLSDAEAAPGETITLTLRVDATEMYNTVGLGFCSNDGTTKYYDDVFSFLSFTENEDTTNVSQFYSLDGNKETIVIGYNEEMVTTPYSGIVCTIQFRIADDADPGVYTIGEGMSHSVKMSSMVLNSAIHPATVTVTGTCVKHQVQDDFYLRDGNSHWHGCKNCSALLDVAPHTDEDGLWETDGTNHWHTCVCGAQFDLSKHTGGTATCVGEAICAVCDTTYGEKNGDNHVGPLKLVGDTVPATCKEDGHLPDTVCQGCGITVTEGKSIPATGNHIDKDGKWEIDEVTGEHYHICGCSTELDRAAHAGGRATCKSQAVCSVCKASYGAIAAEHGGVIRIRNAKAVTCTEDGYTGDEYCTLCGQTTKAGTVIESEKEHAPAIGAKWYANGTQHWQICGGCSEHVNVRNHTGGTVTCRSQAICTECKSYYTPANTTTITHTGPFEVHNAVQVTCGTDGYSGDTYCLGCMQEEPIAIGKTIYKNGEHVDIDGKWEGDENGHWYLCGCGKKFTIVNGKVVEDTVTPHTEGRPATCNAQSVCKDCGVSYGAFNLENHHGPTQIISGIRPSCIKPGSTGVRICLGCSHIIRQGTIIQSTGKHVDADGEWIGNAGGHWYICSCNLMYNKQEHTFAMQYDNTEHWLACTVCGYRSEEGNGKHDHQTPAVNDQFFKDNEKHYHICKDCGHKGKPVEHSFDKNRECICGFVDTTPIEMKIQAEALDTNTQISNTDTITAILDLKQQVENAQVGNETESDAQAEAKAIVDKLLTQIPAIGVDTVFGNSTEEVTVKTDEDTTADLLANMDADDAAYLSYAMKQAKMDSANGEVVEPSFTVSVNVTMADETTKGQDVTAEFIYDAQQEATDSVLTIAAQFDITAEKTVQLGEKELKKDKITELKKEIEIGITLPKDYATVEYFILQTHYDEKTNTYTTTVLEDCDGDKHNKTYVIRVDRFSLYSVYAAQSKPELKITDIEVKNGEATVKLSSAGIAKGIVITAIYTADDRMYDSHVQTANANLENPVFTYETGAYVKVFLLQDYYVPDNAHTPVKTEVTTSATAS